MNLEVIAFYYDRIGTSDPIGRVTLGYNRKGTELKHWREMVENPRRPVIHWHALQVRQTNRCVKFLVVVVAVFNWEFICSFLQCFVKLRKEANGWLATPSFHTDLLVLLFVSLICFFLLFSCLPGCLCSVHLYTNKHILLIGRWLTNQRVSLELVVADYDRIGNSDPIGRVECGYNRKGWNYWWIS